MPAPQKVMLFNLAKLNFVGKMIKLPTDWKSPGDQYPDAFKPSELAVAPAPPLNLFREQTLNHYHVDTAKTIGKALEDYMEGICGAICSGIGNWMKLASVTGVIINGPVGIVKPGSLIGPPLAPLILPTAPMKTPQEIKYSNAIAKAFGSQWQMWHMGVAGTLMYPQFAVFPGPIAPPLPNVPMPLIALPSAGEMALSPMTLKSMMNLNLADPTAYHADDMFDAIAKAFGPVFQLFKTSTMVQNVLGTGPIPTFAPPIVPAGPVVMGVGNAVPGSCLL